MRYVRTHILLFLNFGALWYDNDYPRCNSNGACVMHLSVSMLAREPVLFSSGVVVSVSHRTEEC